MTNLIIVHRSYQGSGDLFGKNADTLDVSKFHIWQTCRRQLFFFESHNFHLFKTRPSDEVYEELDAEQFLIEVLCGLKSPLVGETEVFGQFKQWWTQLADVNFKNKFAARVQHIYSTVKKIREESLCGLGSQSYGSLLRKKINELEAAGEKFGAIDFVGAGQLVDEIVPWVSKKWSYRIWSRNPEKVLGTDTGSKAQSVLHLAENVPLSSLLVVAAPLTHVELKPWISQRSELHGLRVFDFRHDSMNFDHSGAFREYLHLDHFTTEVADQRQIINQKIDTAKSMISAWKAGELSRAQVRPFGWDDL